MQVELNTAKKMTKTESESIKDSIGTLAATPYGSAPFIRNMGIKIYPPPSESDIDRNNYATEVITQAGIWEDRAKVAEVTFMGDNETKVVMTSG